MMLKDVKFIKDCEYGKKGEARKATEMCALQWEKKGLIEKEEKVVLETKEEKSIPETKKEKAEKKAKVTKAPKM